MNPKFSVGEIVIVQSPGYPETNGEYSVLKILTYQEYQHYCSGQFKAPGELFIYKLEGYMATGKIDSECKTDCVSEPSLRKKQQKGDMSFKELMSDLKTNIQERIS